MNQIRPDCTHSNTFFKHQLMIKAWYIYIFKTRKKKQIISHLMSALNFTIKRQGQFVKSFAKFIYIHFNWISNHLVDNSFISFLFHNFFDFFWQYLINWLIRPLMDLLNKNLLWIHFFKRQIFNFYAVRKAFIYCLYNLIIFNDTCLSVEHNCCGKIKMKTHISYWMVQPLAAMRAISLRNSYQLWRMPVSQLIRSSLTPP